MAQEPDFGLPLDVLVIASVGRMQANHEIQEPHLNGLAADTKVDSPMTRAEIDTNGVREPRRGENVLTAGIDKSEDVGATSVPTSVMGTVGRITIEPRRGPSS